jgi:hypothetical protein
MSAVGPDLVLLGFFLGNDVGDDYFYTQHAKLNPSDGSFAFENNNRWPWTALDKLVRACRVTKVA